MKEEDSTQIFMISYDNILSASIIIILKICGLSSVVYAMEHRLSPQESFGHDCHDLHGSID